MAFPRGPLAAVILASFLVTAVARISHYDSLLGMPGEEGRDAFRHFLNRGEKTKDSEPQQEGTRWALLIAGSAGYGNYRHQADVCHAYQLLRRNGVSEQHIVVMMVDDIAHNEDNPHPGTIINRPDGPDVYHGVPKDYTGRHVTVGNFIAALLGNTSAINGGSGKVIASGPNDHVFVYYTDHGGPGILGMPEPPFLMADEVVGALERKHAAKGFKELVFYLEACESGSIFQGLLPPNIHIYATTAANAEESSWGTYCPGMNPPPPIEYETCLGDLYSVAWMEDSDVNDLTQETLYEQYLLVKDRTSNHGTYDAGSHVMLFGEKALGSDPVADFLGDASLAPEADANSGDANNGDGTGMTPWIPFSISVLLGTGKGRKTGLLSAGQRLFAAGEKVGVVGQRDAEVLHLWHKYKNAPEDSPRKQAALSALNQAFSHRRHVDQSVRAMVAAAVGEGRADAMLKGKQAEGKALVDDWVCLREMVRAYEASCGRITQYGMKHMRAFANLCNAAVPVGAVATAAQEVCPAAANAVPLGLLIAAGGRFSV
ncbi:hypothetical protein CLOM_g10053 [Closterium sp. NIES-68]|nr:hypothetical protein CLOM_g10053 [Closterium sp. NIES-68]GJP58769.1 hypothetical protein CLOP_g3378 [Closterium sp. NIES-67]